MLSGDWYFVRNCLQLTRGRIQMATKRPSGLPTSGSLLFIWIFILNPTLHIKVMAYSQGSPPSHTSISVMKQYTLITAANFTWNDAKLKCESIGGTLARVDSETERKALNYLDDQPPWNSSLSSGQYWFGLHIKGEDDECSAKTKYFWQDCSPLFKWANWYHAEPNDCEKDKCIRVHNVQFRTRDCSVKIGVLCEKYDGDCSFEVVYVENLYESPYRKVALDLEELDCQTACRNYVMGDDKQCWIYQTIRKEFDVNMTIIAEHPVCNLFFSNNAYTIDSQNFVDNWANTTTIYVKRCYRAELDEISQPDSLDAWAGISEPNTTCPVIGDCYFEQIGVLDLNRAMGRGWVDTTLDVHGTEQECKDMCMRTVYHRSCWFLDTFSPISGACRLYFLHNDLPDTFNVLNQEARIPTLFMKKCLKEDMTTTTVPTTTTTPKVVFEELRVEKKVTGSYRRKFISIYEDRPSAMGMGIIGATFIIFILASMILSDIPIFYRHAKTVGAKNIRTRNRCFPPKKKPNKPKSVVYKIGKEL